jgi:hypothetical protein
MHSQLHSPKNLPGMTFTQIPKRMTAGHVEMLVLPDSDWLAQTGRLLSFWRNIDRILEIVNGY